MCSASGTVGSITWRAILNTDGTALCELLTITLAKFGVSYHGYGDPRQPFLLLRAQGFDANQCFTGCQRSTLHSLGFGVGELTFDIH